MEDRCVSGHAEPEYGSVTARIASTSIFSRSIEVAGGIPRQPAGGQRAIRGWATRALQRHDILACVQHEYRAAAIVHGIETSNSTAFPGCAVQIARRVGNQPSLWRSPLVNADQGMDYAVSG